MTSEAQSILNQVKSIADSPDIFEKVYLID